MALFMIFLRSNGCCLSATAGYASLIFMFSRNNFLIKMPCFVPALGTSVAAWMVE